jgi:L-cysteine S-thiosulfotransferase
MSAPCPMCSSPATSRRRWTGWPADGPKANCAGIVANAKMTFDGSFMPAFYKTEGFVRPGDAYTGKAPEGALPPILTGQQIEDVVAYLLTLKE